MTEITRVPLQPIAKGALAKLWVGVAAAALAAAGLAYATLPAAVTVEAISEGKGREPKPDEVVLVNYVGKLKSGKVFDQGKEMPLPLSRMIPGFAEGLVKMKQGGKYTMTVPAEKAYGDQAQRDPRSGEEVIPANSDLVFEIELLRIFSEAEFQQIMQMQQMMQAQAQQQAQQAGNPQGAPPAPKQ